MIELIKSLLEKKKVEYIIVENKESSYELFFVNKELQMNRAKDVTKYQVTVYHSHDKYKGSSTFSVHPTMSKKELEEALNDGIYAASLVNNKTFELAKPEDIKQTKNTSNMAGKDRALVAQEIAEAIFKAKLDGGKLNATEVFVYDHISNIYNSNNVHYTKVSTDAEVEFITTQMGKDEEVELYNMYDFKQFSPKELTKRVEKALSDTKLRAQATNMPSFKKIDVMFRKEELMEIIHGYYLSQCNVSSLYSKSSNRKLGENIQGKEISGDKLNITIDPLLKSSLSSSEFDNMCFKNEKTDIIKDGIIKNFYGNRIHAQYLGIDSKVNSNNIVVGKGSLKEKDLKKATYLEILKMSGIQVDDTTGSFAGEIRLALYHHDGKVEPFSGGSITGFINEFAPSMRLSNEIISENNYEGPSFMYLKDATILGK